jgi:DNA-binding NarL/FixJ family response regulator
MVPAFSAGANAYLISVAASDVFIKSLELVMLGETILPPSVLSLLTSNENARKTQAEDSITMANPNTKPLPQMIAPTTLMTTIRTMTQRRRRRYAPGCSLP